METSIKKQMYSFSNRIITRQATYTVPSQALLSPTDPDRHAKVRIFPVGMSFYKEQEHVPRRYPQDRKLKRNIEGFSKASQRNFRQTLISLNLQPFCCESPFKSENNGFFISLNWPQDSELNVYRINGDLEKLSKKFRKDFSESFLGAIWKKELQRQNTPHVHIIALFNTELDTQSIREWAETTWQGIVGDIQPFDTDTRPLYGPPERLINYLLKESYENAGAFCMGRIWGKWNEKTLPFGEPKEFGLSEEDYSELIRRLKETEQGAHSKIIQKFNSQWKGGRVVGDGEILRQLLIDLPSDDGIVF